MNQIIHTLLDIMAGIYFCAALYHLCIAVRRIRPGVHLCFSIVCVMAAGYCLTSKGVYDAPSEQSYILYLQIQFSFAIVFYAGYTWFAAFYTEAESYFLPITICFAAAIIFALNWILPLGIALTDINMFNQIKLAWGERIAFPDMDLNFWGMSAWTTYSLSVYVFVFHSCYNHLQRRQRKAALALAINTALLLCAYIFDNLVDLRLIRSIYIGEFRFLPFVFFMALNAPNEIGESAKEKVEY